MTARGLNSRTICNRVRPIGPGPVMTTKSAGKIRLRTMAAWLMQVTCSISAPSAKDRLSGRRWANCRGKARRGA
jgi:hypothetical protein